MQIFVRLFVRIVLFFCLNRKLVLVSVLFCPFLLHAMQVPIGLCPHGVAFMFERSVSRAVYSYVVFYAL